MTPREHLDQVVRPNMQDFAANYGDLRRAFNSAAAIDALAAPIYWWATQHAPGHVAGLATDDDYRRRLWPG